MLEPRSVSCNMLVGLPLLRPSGIGHRTRLLCAIGVGFWSAVVAGCQATAPVALSEELRAHVQDERFAIITSSDGLPFGVRAELHTMWGSPPLSDRAIDRGQIIDIAEPGAEFQVSDGVVNSELPIRRLVVAGCSDDHCLVYYERGGPHTWRVALFHWTPDATRFESGGAAPGGLMTIDEVRRAILSGTINDPRGVW